MSGELLDRAIDESLQWQLMRHEPSPQVYARVVDAVRVSSARRSDVGSFRSWAIAASSVAAMVLLVDLVLRATGATAIHVDAAAPGRGSLFLLWLSDTAFAKWVNESESMFAYPGILFSHTFGLATVVGLSVAVNARLLGAATRISMTSMGPLFRYLWLGFWINAVSGLMLFVADAPRKAANPLFETKLAFVALGVMVMAIIERQLVRLETDPSAASTGRLRFMAAASLLAWVAAIAAGRLIAYVF